MVPVSPIASHPDTAILGETLDSIRHHLPDVEIILTFDGVRSEQHHRRADYEEFIRRALWRADHRYGNIWPLIFDRHMHQSGMLRAVLDKLETPLLAYIEQDTPLEPDPINWTACFNLIRAGDADVVRFAHESEILPAHRHMSVPGGPAGFARTCQWSQRPHLASTAYYRRIMVSHFSADARCFIEDVMHSVCHEAYRIDGVSGWNQHRLVYFHPEGNIRRSRHLDGRGGEAKLDDTQIF